MGIKSKVRQVVKRKVSMGTRRIVIILLWLALWQLAAVWTDNQILLVGPAKVLYALAQNVASPDFFKIICYSLIRIGLGFFLALFLGLLLGAVGYRLPVMAEILEPAVQALKSVPVASFVVLLLIWFGSGKLSFFISLLIVFPNVYVNTIAGLKSTDTKLLEMAKVFGMGRRNRFFYIYRPALMPYLNSCLKVSLGMGWKSGVAAEVIGLPDYSLGERLYMSKIYLDTADVFAWTITVILVSYVFEKAVLRIIRVAGAWKPYPACAIKEGGTQKPYLPCAVARGRRREKDVQQLGAPVIKISHVYKSYGGMPVLQDCSMEMEAGQRYLLMAPSGAGKTTLLRILTRLDNADKGQVINTAECIGMVFQEDRLCEEYDALCNIMLGMSEVGTDLVVQRWQNCLNSRDRQACGDKKNQARTHGKFRQGRINGKQQIVDYVKREACMILPEDCLTKPVRELSGGMRRRVAFLRAVLSDACFLILDEPFAGLDEDSRIRCGEYLMDRLEGRTLLATTHREDDGRLLRGTVFRISLKDGLGRETCRKET